MRASAADSCTAGTAGPAAEAGRGYGDVMVSRPISKDCRRLLRAYEYVLLLAEATECERALRTAALSALPDQQRRQGESTATSW